jgi:hypothetical protein
MTHLKRLAAREGSMLPVKPLERECLHLRPGIAAVT